MRCFFNSLLDIEYSFSCFLVILIPRDNSVCIPAIIPSSQADVLKGRKLIGRDVNYRQLDLLSRDGLLYIISGIIGGQGFLFGRGNQQITAEIIRRVTRENIIVVASTKKIFELPRQCILIDTGNKKLDNELAGYLKVQTDKNLTFVIKVEVA